MGLLTCFKTHLSFVLNDILHSVQSLFVVVINKTPCLSRFFKTNGYHNQNEEIGIVSQIYITVLLSITTLKYLDSFGKF